MAGFNTLGSNVNTNIGGSFNPALGSIGSGQIGPAGYGIQPPHVSNSFNVGGLGLEGASRPQHPANVYGGSANVYTPGADTSAEHMANVFMAQQGYGDLGLRGTDQGTSYSGYGFGPNTWQDIYRYISNPMGQQADGRTNINRYQDIMNTIQSHMNGNPAFADWLPEALTEFYTNMPLRMASAYNLMPAQVLQQIGIGVPTIPGMRPF